MPESRILLVCGDLRPGLDGVADYVVRLAAELAAAGCAVRILHTGPRSGVPGTCSIGARWRPAALLRAARAARGADAVHVQFAPSMVRFRIGLGLLPLVLPRRPLLVTLHEYGWWRWERRLPAAVWRRLERGRLADRETLLLVPRATAVIVTNASHAAVLRQRFGRRVRAETVPIGANVEVHRGVDRAAARRRLGVAADATVIAFFGFVHPVKGVRYLGEATAALAAEGRDMHLLVIGGFESMALPADEAAAFERELRSHLADSGALDRTTITGFLPPPQVSELLAAGDIACLPFTAGVTGKSGSLLTMLAHGLPTVVTAPPEGVEEDLAEAVVAVSRVRDGDALAAGLRRVLDDPVYAERIAAQGRRWAAQRDWSAIARRHRALCRAVR